METSERAYEKIINYVERQIMQGSYKKGDKLPPERELAALLGASSEFCNEKDSASLNVWELSPASRGPGTLFQIILRRH